MNRVPHCARTPHKVKYLNEWGARTAICRITTLPHGRTQRKYRGPALDAYECTSCGYWHVTKARGATTRTDERSARGDDE